MRIIKIGLFPVALVILFLSIGTFINVYYPSTDEEISFNVLLEAEVNTPYGTHYWIGSGVVIDKEGLIVTARHCVDGADRIRITLHDGTSYFTTEWLMDEDNDIALIKIPVEFENVPVIGNSNVLEKGDNVYGIGNPLGVYEFKVAKGEVEKNNFKRLAIYEDSEYILLDIDIKRGYSGGGVYYKHKLIGIISLGSEDLAFLVPSEYITKLLEQYRFNENTEKFKQSLME